MKDRESQVEPSEREPSEPAGTTEESGDTGGHDDNEPDVEVRSEGDRVVVDQRSQGTRGQRRAAERQRQEAERNQKIDALERQIRELTATIATQRQAPVEREQQSQPARPSRSPETENIVREQEAIVSRIERERDPDKIEALRNKWHDLEDDRVRHVSRSAIRDEVERALRDRPAPEPYELTRLKQEYHDVFQNDDARELARSYMNQAVIRARRNGKTFDPIKLHRESLQKAAEEFGFRTPEAVEPSNGQRSRFSGGPTGTSRGSGVSRQLTEHEKRSAEAWAEGTGIPKDKIYEAFTKQVLLKGDPDYFSNKK